MINSKILVLGKIQSVRGVRGGLRVITKGDLMDLMKVPCEIILYEAKGIRDGFLLEPRLKEKIKMNYFQPLDEETAEIHIENLNNREDAFNYRGLFIGMDIEEAREKFHDPEDPYLFEYIDCLVYESGREIGKVDRVEDYSSRQWLIVIDKDGKEHMLPMQGGFIESFDVESGKIILSENSGLFE